jgi:hypothetical protein
MLLVTAEVLFGCGPTVLLVTSIVTVQLLMAGIVIPLNPNAVAVSAKLFVPAPAHVPPAA